MGRLIAFTNLTLDGVMQAPGRPDEDTRGGFERGGWAVPYAAMQESGDALSNMGAVLFGRWTYASFYDFWPNQPANPYTEFFNTVPKYVVSTTLTAPLSWSNSTLLTGDVAESVGALKAELDRDLVLFGSGELIRSLMRHGLIDRFVLLIHPLVLGAGRRLFADDGPPASLRLVDSRATSTGVLIASYDSVQEEAHG